METRFRGGISRTRRGGLLACSLAFTLLGLPAVLAAQGLNLQQAVEKDIEQFDRPNPHFELECSECHEGTPVQGKDTAATVKFKNGDKGNVDLCYGCHDASDNVHPIHVDPLKGTPPVKVPPDYPLERAGEKKGTVVCSTCHFIHTKTAGMKLLRGFPASSHPDDVKNARNRRAVDPGHVAPRLSLPERARRVEELAPQRQRAVRRDPCNYAGIVPSIRAARLRSWSPASRRGSASRGACRSHPGGRSPYPHS